MRLGLLYWALRPLIRSPHRAKRIVREHVAGESRGQLLDFLSMVVTLVQLLFTLAWAVVYLAFMLFVAALVPVGLYLLAH